MSLTIRNDIWKDIPGYEGLYKVSNKGSIKSSYSEKVLKNIKDKDGYHRVNLYKNNSMKRFGVHNLVLLSFLGKLDKDVTHHINHNRSDNRLENLKRVSFRENAQDKKKKHSSIYSGVHWVDRLGKWKSQIEYKNKVIYLGIFEKEIEAMRCYLDAVESIKLGREIKISRRSFSSKYKGVSLCKQTNRWKAYLTKNGKTKQIGRFDSEIEAYNKVKEYDINNS
jgi:hypothetical protein